MTITTGSPLKLEQGYELYLKSINIEGDNVYLELTRNGEIVDSAVIYPSKEGATLEDKTYSYEPAASAPDSAPAPLIRVHFKNAFRGADMNLATIDGVYQISDTPTTLNEGDKFGKMTVEEIGPEKIVMANVGESIVLTRNKDIELLGDIRLKTADDDSLRYYLYRELGEPGVYDLRGSAASGDYEWTAQNFAGFYYDLHKNLGTESLTTRIGEDNTLMGPGEREGYEGAYGEDHAIAYRTFAQSKDYEYEDWGCTIASDFWARSASPGTINSGRYKSMTIASER